MAPTGGAVGEDGAAPAAEEPSAAEALAEVAYEVTVPPNARVGDQLKMTLPSGVQALITVPEGAVPGAILTFELPAAAVGAAAESAAAEGGMSEEKAAVAIQARVRGFKTRQESAKMVAQAKASAAPADDPQVIEVAAVKLQAVVRGKKGREESQKLKVEAASRPPPRVSIEDAEDAEEEKKEEEGGCVVS